MGRTKRVFGKEADTTFRENGKRRIETALFAARELARLQQDTPVRPLNACKFAHGSCMLDITICDSLHQRDRARISFALITWHAQEVTETMDLEDAKERIWKLCINTEDDDVDALDAPEPPAKFPSTLVPTMVILDNMCSAIVDSLHGAH